MFPTGKDFIVEDMTAVDISPNVATRSTKFDIFTKVGNVGVQMRWNWEPFKKYYYLDILTEKAFQRRIHPRLGLVEVFQNFDPIDADNPHCILFFSSTDDEDRSTIDPDTLGTKHFVCFLRGRFG